MRTKSSIERRIDLWMFRPFVSSPPGRFALWTFRHLDVSPPRNGRFAPLSGNPKKTELEEAAQGKPSAKYRPTRLVVDAALWRIGKSRHGSHKIAYISINCQRI